MLGGLTSTAINARRQYIAALNKISAAISAADNKFRLLA